MVWGLCGVKGKGESGGFAEIGGHVAALLSEEVGVPADEVSTWAYAAQHEPEVDAAHAKGIGVLVNVGEARAGAFAALRHDVRVDLA